MRANSHLTSSFTMWSILLFLGSAILGGAVFAVTQAAKQHESGIEEMNRSILAERQSIRVLEAEWAYLSRPQRLEELMAMKQENGTMPPTPAPIETILPEASVADATPAITETEPAAGKIAEPEIVAKKIEKEPEAKPVKTASIKTEPKVKPKVQKTSKPPVAKTASVKTKGDDVWSIAKSRKTAAARPVVVYRQTAVASSSRGGMRPIVE